MSSKWANIRPTVGSQIDWSDPITKGLVGCFLCNEGAGQYLIDMCGNGNGASNGAGLRWGQAGTFTSILSGLAVQNTSSTSRFLTGKTSPRNNIGPLTILTEVWANSDGNSNVGGIFGKNS